MRHLKTGQVLITLFLISALIGGTLAMPLSHSRAEEPPHLELLFSPELLPTDLSSFSEDYGVKPLMVSYEHNLEEDYY